MGNVTTSYKFALGPLADEVVVSELFSELSVNNEDLQQKKTKKQKFAIVTYIQKF